MPTNTFTVNLPRSKVLLLYKAEKNRIVVTADNGQRISLPWRLLQPHVSQAGISGRFEITFDDGGRCQSLIRMT